MNMVSKIQRYINGLKNKGNLSWDEVVNYVMFGDVRGKLTVYGYMSARELGMDPVAREELDFYDLLIKKLKQGACDD